MKKSYIFFLVSVLSIFTACKKDEPTPPPPANPVTELTATINGSQQVPANSSAATGTFTGSYNSDTKLLTYTVTYQGMTPNIAHIHIGAPGATGKVAVPFNNLTSPITGAFTLDVDQATALLNNGMYVNMHSTGLYSGGEIRGDIKKK